MNLRDFFKHYHWLGKIFGAIVGYILGGPPGVLFGILLGNLLDRKILNYFTSPYYLLFQESNSCIKKIFYDTTFAVMGYIAKSDGYISRQEIDIATLLMNEMQLNNNQKIVARYSFNSGKNITFDLAASLTRLYEVCYNKPDLIKLFLDIQYRAAQTDSFMKKINVLDIIFKRFGFAPLRQQKYFYEQFDLYSKTYQNNNYKQQSYYQQKPRNNSTINGLDNAYDILELNPGANKQEVKQAYRRLISRNHPDKLIAKGLPEAMIKAANDKTQRIRKAYEKICASKGW